MLLIAAVLGSIYSGVATATESPADIPERGVLSTQAAKAPSEQSLAVVCQ